jgi:hypothetical protein
MTRKPADLAENGLSLIYRGALPEILREIARQIDEGNASAEHFSARVGRESFDLQATISLHGSEIPPRGRKAPNPYPGA